MTKRFSIQEDSPGWNGERRRFTVWDNEDVSVMGTFETKCGAEQHLKRCEKANPQTEQ